MTAWTYDDGGRAAAGFRGDAGDCVTRAIAIALELDYRQVYDDLAERRTLFAKGRSRHAKAVAKRVAKNGTSARAGVPMPVTRAWLAERGWVWTPTMAIGSGTTVHLRASELPGGRLVARCSGHLVAVIDGVVHDTSDPTRDGTRAVYGYWRSGVYIDHAA